MKLHSDGYDYLEHSTDALVQACGSDLKSLFENCAKGLVNIMFDINKVESLESCIITADGDDLESLLYDWLEKVLLKILIEQIVVSKFSIEISENYLSVVKRKYFLKAIVGGEKVDYDKHGYKIEIKAITYHELKIRRIESSYVATFLADL